MNDSVFSHFPKAKQLFRNWCRFQVQDQGSLPYLTRRMIALGKSNKPLPPKTELFFWIIVMRLHCDNFANREAIRLPVQYRDTIYLLLQGENINSILRVLGVADEKSLCKRFTKPKKLTDKQIEEIQKLKDKRKNRKKINEDGYELNKLLDQIKLLLIPQNGSLRDVVMCTSRKKREEVIKLLSA